ncbi:hypothetical protein [Streptomyces sp. NPDC058579]|uniref:hypothetical protein n=1 Tax=Streptomyces sp. NPDC058579 TaxID=3346548 RepID=UPI00365D1DA2
MPGTSEPEAAVVLDRPVLLADHLADAQDAAVREVLASGRTIRRGQGYLVRVIAPLALHRVALKQCAALSVASAASAGRKAYRAYADRITSAAQGRDRCRAQVTAIALRQSGAGAVACRCRRPIFELA